MDFDIIKTTAREKLRGHYAKFWGLYIVFTLIYLLILTIPRAILGTEEIANEYFGAHISMTTIMNWGVIGTFLFDLVGSIIFALLGTVLSFFMLQVVRGEKAFIGEALEFAGKHWFTILVMSIITSVLTTVGTLIFVIPGVILALGFALSGYVLIDDPKLGAWGAVKHSWELMRGHKVELFQLILSFIGWAIPYLVLDLIAYWIIAAQPSLISELTFGHVHVALGILIALSVALSLYVLPYFLATMATYYTKLAKGKK